MTQNNADMERIHAMLNHDFETDLVFPDQMSSILHLLQIADPPTVDEAKTDDLIHTLQAEFASNINQKSDIHPLAMHFKWSLIIVRSQLRTLQYEIWLASPLIILLGTLTTLITYDPSSQLMTPLAIIAPIIAAVGVGLLYDDDTALIRELERATMTSATILLFARLMIIFSLNLGLAVTGSLFLSLVQPEISFLPLIMTWLAPMTFLSALAFFVSTISMNAFAGGLISFILWALHLIMQMAQGDSLAFQIISLQGLGADTTKPYLILFAIPMVIVAFWVTTRQESLGSYTV